MLLCIFWCFCHYRWIYRFSWKCEGGRDALDAEAHSSMVMFPSLSVEVAMQLISCLSRPQSSTCVRWTRWTACFHNVVDLIRRQMIFLYFSFVRTLSDFYATPPNFPLSLHTRTSIRYYNLQRWLQPTYLRLNGPRKLQKIRTRIDGPKFLLIPRCIHGSNIRKCIHQGGLRKNNLSLTCEKLPSHSRHLIMWRINFSYYQDRRNYKKNLYWMSSQVFMASWSVLLQTNFSGCFRVRSTRCNYLEKWNISIFFFDKSS